MKGQYLTVEYVLFFAIGVAMIIAVYFMFSGINGTIRTDAAQMQLERTSELIRGTAMRIFDAAKETDSTIRYDLDLPPMLSSCIYKITIYDNKLNLNCTDNQIIGSVMSLYGINITSNEILYSTKGFIRIEGDANGVMLK